MTYAKDTSVSVEKSRAEIESTLSKYGATAFAYACQSGRAMIQFTASDRHVRFILILPSPEAEEFRRTDRGRRRRSQEMAYAAWEQACRQRWRSLLLCIKAKLVAVEDGIEQFEEAFMAHIVVPGGQTVSELMRPQIDKAYADGSVPPGIAGLLPYEESK